MIFTVMASSADCPSLTTSANERFGATAAGRADLKSSAEMPPLRQAAIPLAAISADSACGLVSENLIKQ